MRSSTLLLGALCGSALAATPSYAEDTSSGSITLPPVVVTADRDTGTKTVPSNADAERTIKRTPGGVAVVDAEDFEDSYTLNFEDTLALTPGVYAQKRYGEEVRLSIRGSGLSRGFHLRGLTLLQDGIPFNLADGAADFQEADTLAFQRLEVFKGANALQFGSTTLGGAVNMVTKTGRSQPGHQVRFEVGSNTTFRANAQSGYVFGNSDLFLSLTGTTSQGFREHDDQKSVKFNGNFGTALSNAAETRFYLSANVIDQELPGSVSRSDALNNPKPAGRGVIASDQKRDIRSIRVSNKTTFEIGDDDTLDVGAFISVKELFHPITPFVGVIDQESTDYGVFAQASGEHQLAGHRNIYRVGLTTQFGKVKAKRFANVGGSRGALTANADQYSRNIALYGENSFFVTPEWAVVTGAQLSWSEREYTDLLRPTEDDTKTFSSFNPKIGVLYEPTTDMQFFANVSRSHEPPTFSELTQGGTVGFTPVEAQEAWTTEIGTRGEAGAFMWDISAYRAWIDGEMLQFTRGPGIPATTFNAQDTIHQGVEVGLTARLAEDFLSSGDHLQWRNAYTFSDYFFDGDVQFGDNDIAGQPKHFYQSELRYDHADGWHAALDWELASDADVDFANTLNAPGYGIVGFNAGVDVTQSVNVYLDARNLLDQEFISTFSTIVNTAGNTSVFYPGEGRQVFAGIRVKL
ncbi:TonB-dependent receptor [Pyruvatibacter sp.]|uniref:TonB-dependent receptor family protein n=1 Tax=Pyruvatibacter sp. TaxID=1981328 RepID=UPI003267DD8B